MADPNAIGMAEIKGRLAGMGMDLSPSAQMIVLGKPTRGDVISVVVLDRVSAAVTPSYCIHGYATCIGCDAICFIGSETSKSLQTGSWALCMECAVEHIPPDAIAVKRARDH